VSLSPCHADLLAVWHAGWFVAKSFIFGHPYTTFFKILIITVFCFRVVISIILQYYRVRLSVKEVTLKL